MHIRFGDVLDHNRDIIVPCTDRLIVRRRDETSVVVDESNRVDRSQMLVVFLRDFGGVHVVLEGDEAGE